MVVCALDKLYLYGLFKGNSMNTKAAETVTFNFIYKTLIMAHAELNTQIFIQGMRLELSALINSLSQNSITVG